MSSQPTKPACPSRQQLDELEALMQRMLELPVADPENEVSLPDVPPPEERDTLALPDTDAWEEITPDPKTVTVDESPEVHSIAAPGEHRHPPPPEPDDFRFDTASETADRSRLKADWQDWAELEKPRPERWAQRRSATSTGWFIWPMVWTNRLFDAWTAPLGRSGRWLRGPHGRAWVGWTGITLLFAAALWGFLAWMGWSS